MGDVLLCTPAVRETRRAFPGATIDFLTEAGGAAVLEDNPHLDEVLVSGRGLRRQWRLLRELRERRYDAVVDFRSTGSTARAAWVSGAPIRIGTRGRGPRNLVYTELLPRSSGPVYIVRQKLSLLAPLGIGIDSTTDLSLVLSIGDEERQWAATAWERLGLVRKARVVIISAVARDPRKQWGAGRWAEVADELAEAGMAVLLTNGPGEEQQVEKVVGAMRHRPVWGHGPTTPRQLAALCARASLWVGHDGGAKHLAVAAGTPTVSVMRAGLGPIWTDTSPGSPHRYVEGVGPPSDVRGGLDALAPRAVVDAALALHEAVGRP